MKKILVLSLTIFIFSCNKIYGEWTPRNKSICEKQYDDCIKYNCPQPSDSNYNKCVEQCNAELIKCKNAQGSVARDVVPWTNTTIPGVPGPVAAAQ